jgi:single-strand DNA-binding protein
MSERYNRVDNNLQKEVGFFNVETWSKLAETCGEKGREGRSVRIVGRLREEHWTSLYGKLNSRVIIVAEHVEFRPEAKKEHGNEDGI